MAKGITRDIWNCHSLLEMEMILAGPDSEFFDGIHVSTLWAVLGKLHDRGAPQAETMKMGRRILGMTLARLDQMETRAVSQVLFGMGKVRMTLDGMPDAPYVAALLQDAVLAAMEAGAATPMDISNVWYALKRLDFDWDASFLQDVAAETVSTMATWEFDYNSTRACSDAMFGIGRTKGIQLSEGQRQQLGSWINGCIRATVKPYEAAEPLWRNADKVLLGCSISHVPLSNDVVQLVANTVLDPGVPLLMPKQAGGPGRESVSATLFYAIKLGYRPAGQGSPEAWVRLLMYDEQGSYGRARAWGPDEVAGVMAALSSIKDWRPPPAVVSVLEQRMRALQPPVARSVAMRVQIACQVWGLRLPAYAAAALPDV